jgi:competence protein ComEA
MVEPTVPSRPEPRRNLPPASFVERARVYWDDPRVRIGALLLGALIAGLAWYQLGVRGTAGAGAAPAPTTATTSRSAFTSDATRPDGTSASSGTGATGGSTTGDSTTGGPLIVQVAGSVVRPGVVRVKAGSRVIDAIQAAGGGLPGADLNALNLASKVIDGQRIAVALVGAPTPVQADPGASTGGAADGTPTGPINLNTATETQLETLPGIGPSLASAILAEREKRGGFKNVGELQDVRGIGELRFADIKDLVSV